ncbi:chalcone isomerase family protein [Aliivibrio sp. S4MY1]|nr:chalcone isomerase family protein [Aliivibrio sp. S4MY1]MDD9202285.1 chalcone isomerase family protein [Aliivibrio sp. S4MY1]
MNILTIVSLLTINSVVAAPLQGLQSSGKSELSWFLISVYEAQLFTSSGKFQYGQYPQALEIEYYRNITKENLIKATKEQWEEQSIKHPDLDSWLLELEQVFPDVKPEDKLVFSIDEIGNNQFFLNDKPIGEIASKDFSQLFLDIWVSEKTTYPELRLELIGEK